jgi:probable phosphoglycerate mutase
MKPLALEAGRLVRELGSVRFGWIPRARNSRADTLANRAMDAQAAR